MNADLVFAAEYFDFQPACLSQFKIKYTSQMFTDTKGSKQVLK